MSKRFAKEVKSLFGEDVFIISQEFNRSSQFTNEQVETIENTCRQILKKTYDKSTQRQFIEELDWQRSCLLCAWVMRGGKHFLDC